METLLTRWRVPFLSVLGILTLFFGYQCLGLQVEQDNRSMSADLTELESVESRFEGLFHEGDGILIAVSRSDLFSEAAKEDLRSLVGALEGISGVNEIHSLLDSDFAVVPSQVNLLVSPDRTTTGIHLLLDDFGGDPGALDRLVTGVQKVVADHRGNWTRLALSGLPLVKHEASRLVLRDQRIFSPLCFLILGVVLYFITRHFTGMLLPLALAGLTIIWTLGLYAWCGQRLNMITSLLPPVIMTLSASTAIHLYMEWLQSDEPDNHRRIAGVIRKLTLPCLFASLTTVIGFLSLLLSDTPAVRLFGGYAAIGVAIAFVVGMAGLAVALSFCRIPRDGHHRDGLVGRSLSRLLDGATELALRHPRKVVLVTVLLCIVGVAGAMRVESNTDLLHFLGENSRLVRDTRYIDEHLTGTGVIELLITRRDGEPVTSAGDLAALTAYEEKILTLPHVRHTLGLVDLLPADLPPGMADPSLILSTLSSRPGVSSLASPDFRTMRLTIAVESVGTREGAVLIDSVREAAVEKLGDAYEVSETGGFHRIVAESNHLTASQVKSFGVALAFILLAIGVIFRSLQFTALAFLPNVTPLLLTAAIMGFGGIDLSTGTSMIASVVIGIAVDDTIHFMAGFRRSYKGDGDETIRRTMQSTGRSLVATTLALSLGFWVAIFGSFEPTVLFALLSGITMWFALAFDLVVLPACLKLAYTRWEARTT